MTTFEDLDNDVLYLILDYLHLERYHLLQTLRCTSLRLKDFADAVAHRTLSLVDDEAHEQITYRLTERLKDPSDKLCHYVRDLRVVGFKGDDESYCLNTALILDCVRRAYRLNTFTWDCDQPISKQALDILHQHSPEVQVYAKITLLDHNLLQTPRLYRLEVSVPLTDLYDDQCVSLLSNLKPALLQLPSLRHLGIDTHPNTNIDISRDIAPHELQIPLDLGDKLPSLASLQFRSKHYTFNDDHCKRLLTSMDCERLQRLTIGSPNPISFFEHFAGKLSGLTYLNISYASSPNDPRHLRLAACTKFVAKLNSLRELVFCFDKLDLRSDFARMLQDVHGPHLVHLSLHARFAHIAGPELCGNLRKFLFKFTSLKYLDMVFPDILSYHRCLDCEGYNWEDPNRFSIVPPLPSLREVNLSIRAPYSERPLITHINTHARCAISYLWATFAMRSGSQLESLSIRFWRWETGRTTQLKEVIYDTARLRGRLNIKVRHHREIPVEVYQETLEQQEDGSMLVNFEAL